MSWLRERPIHATLLAFSLAAAAVLAVAAAYGFSAFGNAWSHLHGGWLVLTVGAELLAIPAYARAYRTLAYYRDGPELTRPTVLRIVTAGFGPFAVAGGFSLDKRALHAIGGDENDATLRVLGLGALEWALLAPAACIAALVLLLTGDPRPMRSLLWPWILAVPIGFALGLGLATADRVKTLRRRGGGRLRRGLATAIEGVGILRNLMGALPGCEAAFSGMALYWVLDIASFYGALRFVGLHVNLGEGLLAYATGYALTRRSMPLGGAGVTEVLMTFALHWVGQPVAPALAATVVYRVFNFVVPAAFALWVRPRVRPLLRAAEQGRTPAPRARRRAAAPLRLLRH